MVIVIMQKNKENFLTRLFNRFRRKQKDAIKDIVKNNTKELVDNNYKNLINNTIMEKIVENINVLYQKSNQELFRSNKQTQERIKRYRDYDFIVKKIPEQKRQLNLMYRLVINPEIYRKDFLNISFIGDIGVKQNISTDDKGENISLMDFLKMFIRKNDIYKVLKKQIFDQLMYGDGFVEIQPVSNDKSIGNIPFIKLTNISPDRVIILQIGNVKFGYLILQNNLSSKNFDETKLTIDFLVKLLDKYDDNFLKNFSNVVVKTYTHLNETQELKDVFEEILFDDFNSIEKTKLIEMIHEDVLLQEQLQDYQSSKFITEQGMNQVNTGTYLDNFITQIDLSYYFTKTNDKILERLMGVDEVFEDIVGVQNVKYVPPQYMQNFKITDFVYYPYGQSIIDSQRPIQSLILLLEYQVVLYRLLKSPDRKKIVIDVTNIKEERIPEFVNRVKSSFTTQKNLDLSGEITESLDLMTLFEDYFVLKKNGNEMIDIENVEGGDIQSQIDDLKYWREKLIQSLGIPPSYLGYQESLSGTQTVLTIQDQRVQREVLKLQEDINQGINELFTNIFFVLSNNIDSKWYNYILEINKLINNNKLEFSLFTPQQLEQKERQDMIRDRLETIDRIHDMLNIKYDDLFIYFGIFEKSELDSFTREEIKNKDEEEKRFR